MLAGPKPRVVGAATLKVNDGVCVDGATDGAANPTGDPPNVKPPVAAGAAAPKDEPNIPPGLFCIGVDVRENPVWGNFEASPAPPGALPNEYVGAAKKYYKNKFIVLFKR